jgi:predicted GNAT family acetyltransferase
MFGEIVVINKGRFRPSIKEQVDGLLVIKDGPSKKPARKTEVLASGLAPAEVVERLGAADVGWHFVHHMVESDEEAPVVKAAYKEVRYRTMFTTWVFVHDMGSVPRFESEPPARLIRDQAQMDSVNQVASQKVKLRPGLRQFAVYDDARDYGWVTDIPIGDAAWVSNLYVHSEFRGRGFGRSLMSALLACDKEAGVTASVLLASMAGARLYPHLGYRQIGVMQTFCPMDRP